MIFRKPYGFLIKHFKLIHLIMTFFMAILIYQTNLLLEFFNDFIGSSQTIIGTAVVNGLFNNYTYIFAISIVLIATIIFVLMSFKDKPRIYYILTIIGYTLLIVLYTYSVSTVGKMQVELIDERLTRAIRDFLNIIFLFQIYSIFISLIRSIGLDLKKFDFKEDAEELNITDKDSEEFEVNVEFDSHTLKRKLRRGVRNFRYYLIENKTILLIIFGTITLISGFLTIRALLKQDIMYNVGEPFYSFDYNMAILDSYITENDYKANKITSENESLVVVKFKIMTPNKTERFIYGKLALQIDKEKFYHTYKYASMLTDVGTTYTTQKLTDNYQEFLLVYEIPSELKDNSMKLVYTEQIVEGIFSSKSDDIKIKINPINLDKTDVEENINLKQKYIFGTGLLKNYELEINSFEVGNEFKIKYNSCVRDKECYNFYEIVKPSLSGITDKGVLRLNMNLNTPENGLFNIKNLITKFGIIEYEIKGNKKSYIINNVVGTTHNDNNYYFEINKEIIDADKINLVIKARNDIYRFKLK